MGAHGVDAASAYGNLAANQTKLELVPLVERISIPGYAPEKENLSALIDSRLVFLGNGPSDIDVKAGVPECNT